MNSLTVTNEMQRFQDKARRFFNDRKAIDLDAVIIGWNLDTGRVLYSEAKNATIELLEKPAPHITNIVKVSMNGNNVETSIDTLARLIVTGQVEVR